MKIPWKTAVFITEAHKEVLLNGGVWICVSFSSASRERWSWINSFSFLEIFCKCGLAKVLCLFKIYISALQKEKLSEKLSMCWSVFSIWLYLRYAKNVAEVLFMSGDESGKCDVRTINRGRQLEVVTAVMLFHWTEHNFYYSYLQDARTPQGWKCELFFCHSVKNP